MKGYGGGALENQAYLSAMASSNSTIYKTHSNEEVPRINLLQQFYLHLPQKNASENSENIMIG